MQDEQPSKLVSVRAIKDAYQLSYYTLYSLIKTDPSFPSINLGPKKNYRIHQDLFDQWLKDRSKIRQKASFQIPSADDLISMANPRRSL